MASIVIPSPIPTKIPSWSDTIAGCMEIKDASGNVLSRAVPTLTCIPAVFQNIVEALLLFVGIIAVVLLIIAGIRYISAGGDAKKVETAHHAMTFAIAGLLIVLFSFLIINLIGYFTGTNCITQFGFDTCK